MDTQQLIRASADVVTITHFAPGDVYKRIETAYSGEAILRFGVVQDVMNNGADAAFTALEFRADYNGTTCDLKVYDGGKPAALYAATPEEVTAHFDDLRKATADKRDRAAEEFRKAEEAVARVDELGRQALGRTLSAPAVAAGVIDA